MIWSRTVHEHSWIVHEYSRTKHYKRSWTFMNMLMNGSWIFLNNKWDFHKVHEFILLGNSHFVHVHGLFLNSDNSWTKASSWTTMNQIVNEHLWTFIKCVHELFMNVSEQQMRHSWNSWTVNLVHERPKTKIIHEPDSSWIFMNVH